MPVPVPQCHSWPDGQWEAAGAGSGCPWGLASSEGPGGCSGGLVKGVQRSSAGGIGPALGRRVGRTPTLTYLLGTKENETPFAAPVYTWAW